MKKVRDILFPENTKFRKKLRKMNIILKEVIDKKNIQKFFNAQKEDGFKVFYYVKKYLNSKTKPEMDEKYNEWIKKNEIFQNKKTNEKLEIITILIKMTDNSYIKYFKKLIDSLLNQIDLNYEVIVINGCNKKRKIIEDLCDKNKNFTNLNINKNSVNIQEINKYTKGRYCIFLRENIILSKECLYEINKIIEKNANVDFIYSDNDYINILLKNRYNPFFKPDFSPDTLRSFNYIGNFFVVKKDIVLKIKNINLENIYDIIFKCTESSKCIEHVKKILYHSLELEENTNVTDKIAIKNQIDRLGLNGNVRNGYITNTYKIDYKLVKMPLVSIIIPNKDEIEILHKCINSILEKTTYNNYEIIIIENNSEDEKTFEYYEKLKENKKIKILEYKEKGFNYSKIINYGVKQAKGEYIIQLNNDTEIITKNWIEQMISYVQREDIGAVGVKLLYPDKTVQHSGTILGLGGIAGHACANLRRFEKGYFFRNITIQNVSAVTGACMMCKKSIYYEVNFMNEDLSVAFNDVDFCMKIRKLNKLIIYTPFVELIHYESKTRGEENTPAKIERFNDEIDRFTSIWKNELKEGDPYYNKNLDLKNENQYQLKLN
ncbi:MAG: glycosyltransferase [Candidatus Scatovivens sp.]